MFYFVKTPWWLKKLYPKYIWDCSGPAKTLYLTFDDGPHPEATPFVLAELKKHGAHATFFCIGKNVLKHPGIYRQILDEGHRVGNHTQNHLNGWKTPDHVYLRDIAEAAEHIDSSLFRPPYGRIKTLQAKNLSSAMKGRPTEIIMWDVLSGDFDAGLSNEKCLKNVITNARPGSIIVFHDSQKSLKKILFALPKTLEFFAGEGFSFKSL